MIGEEREGANVALMIPEPPAKAVLPRRASGHLLYIVGPPGAGKSNLVDLLTHRLKPYARVEERPFAHTVWAPGVVELGCRREAFSGTDALGMNVQPKVLTWLADEAPGYVFGEGDRLGNDSFLAGALAIGYDVQVIRLVVSPHVAEARRRARAAELGVPLQNPTWLKGRLTKVRNLAGLWETSGRLHTIDGDQKTTGVVMDVLALGNPVIEALRRNL